MSSSNLRVNGRARAQELGRKFRDVDLSACLFGEYFLPDEKKLANASIRFRSNKIWFLKALEHAVPDLLRFAWIDPDLAENKLQTRDANAELDSANLKWCDEHQPFWQGLKSMMFLLTDRTNERRMRLVDKQVEEDQFSEYAKRNFVERTLARTLGRADALVGQNVLNRLQFEAIPNRVWGNELTTTVQGLYLALVSESKIANTHPAKFCAAIQKELSQWWSLGQQDSFSLTGLFPNMTATSATVKAIRKVQWDPPPTNVGGSGFKDPKTASRIIAAALLDFVLRKGTLS